MGQKPQSLPLENSKCHWQLKRSQNTPRLTTSASNFPKTLRMETNVGCAIRISSQKRLPFPLDECQQSYWGMINYVDFFVTIILMLLLSALALSFLQKDQHKELLIRSLLQKVKICHTNETRRELPKFNMNKKC